MWVRFFRISDGTTVKTQYFNSYDMAMSAAKSFVKLNPDCDWEGM